MACLWFTPGEPQIPPLIGSFRIHPQMLFSGIRALDASCKARLKFWVSGRLLESRRSKLDSPVGPAAYGLTGLRAIPRPMPRPMPRPASGTHAHAVTPPLKSRPCLSSPRDACARRDSTPQAGSRLRPAPRSALSSGRSACDDVSGGTSSLRLTACVLLSTRADLRQSGSVLGNYYSIPFLLLGIT